MLQLKVLSVKIRPTVTRARAPRQVRKKSVVKLRKDVKKRLDTVFGAVWDVKDHRSGRDRSEIFHDLPDRRQARSCPSPFAPWQAYSTARPIQSPHGSQIPGGAAAEARTACRILYSAILYSVLISALRLYGEPYCVRVMRLRRGPRAGYYTLPYYTLSLLVH